MQIWKIDMTYLAQLDISSYIKLKGQIENKFVIELIKMSPYYLVDNFLVKKKAFIL